MQDFWLYFELGWQHIADWQGYDHILFVAVLCGIYRLTDWKKMLFLITAFTLGHSVTLALSVFDIVKISSDWIEFLIPVTICVTALINITEKNSEKQRMTFNYLLTLFFGLIHGLGFSNYLKSLLGKNENIVFELLAFNLGLEFGQLLIVLFLLIAGLLITSLFRIERRQWNFFLSSAIFGIAFIMAVERFNAIFIAE